MDNLSKRMQSLSPEKRKLMEIYLKNLKGTSVFSSIEPVGERDYYPVSSAQKRLFMVHQLEGANVTYNIPSVMLIEGALDKVHFRKSIHELVKRHESLRTCFELIDGEVVQKIVKDWEIEINFIESNEESVKTVIENMVQPFDLSKAPLLRVWMIELSENRNILFYDMHHIISDGISSGIIINELAAIYNGIQLPELRIQYKDFTVWQNKMLSSGEIKNQEEYWINVFQGEIPAINLPIDYPRPPLQSFEGDKVSFEAGEDISRGLQAIAAQYGATIYMVLLAAFNVLLSKYSGQEDIVVGSPTAGRKHADLENIVGMFVNTLAMRNFPEGNKTFIQFLNEVKENSLRAFENQDYQFEALVEKLDVKRDLSRNPLFDVMFALQNMRISASDVGRLRISPFEFDSSVSKFDMTLTAVEVDKKISFSLEYSTKLFKRETIERLRDHFIKVLDKIVKQPEIKLSDISLLSEEEKQQILFGLNNTGADYPRGKTIHRLFEEQAERTPDNIALVFKEKSLTYRELNQKANRLACVLRDKGVGRNLVVGIILERSFEMIVGIMAVLKAGGAYLPISHEFPKDRVNYMLRDSEAVLLLTHREYENVYGVMKIETIYVEEESLYCGDNSNRPSENRENDLAYVIYTSGSTGKPKGVMVEHSSVVNVLTSLQKLYPLKETDNFLFKTTYTFDVSVAELFGWFCEGGRLTLLSPGSEKSPLEILDAIDQHDVTHINFVPSMFNVFINQLEIGDVKKLNKLKYIFLAGEAVSPGIIHKFNSFNTGIRLENLYGPTESTIYATSYPLEAFDQGLSVPIGKPLDNIKAYIVDQWNRPTPIGVPGELCLSGVGLARGYINNENLTKERFVKNPFCNNERMYKTGDLARWLPDGNIEFLGRIDHQVKIRGYRIELGEIESVLLKQENVKEVVVMVNEDTDGSKYLCGYLVSDIELKASDLRMHLLKELPDYMIPTCFVQLEKIPLTPNGKVDRKALPKTDDRINTGVEYEAPANEIEEKLVMIWGDILNRKHIGINDNFFELGGHSLKAINLVSNIKKAFNVEVPIREVFSRQTIKDLSKFIYDAEKSEFSMIRPVDEQEFYSVSSAQKRLFLINQLEGPNTAYNMTTVLIMEGILDKERLKKSFKVLIDRHDSLRTSFEMMGENLVQRINKEVNFEISCWETTEEKVKDLIFEAIKPFELGKAPLLRVCLFKISNKKHILVCDLHHIISDGLSLGILIKEFIQLYNGERLSDLRLQYKDFSQWQNEMLKSEEIMKQEAFWLKMFSGDLPFLKMPLDYRRPEFQTFEGRNFQFEISHEIKEGLELMAQKYGTTLNGLLFAVYSLLLNKYTGQENIVVGSIIAGRNHIDLENIIGMFANFLPVRIHINQNADLEEFIKYIRDNLFEAYENQDYQFEELVAKLSNKIDHSRNPIFDTMLVYHNELENSAMYEIDELKIYNYDYENRSSKLDIKLDVFSNENGLSCLIEYRTSLFKEKTIEAFASRFRMLLKYIIDHPTGILKDINIFSDEEKLEIEEKREKPEHNPEKSVKLVVSATFTAEPIEDYITWWCRQFGEQASVSFASYNQVFQELLDPKSLISTNTGVNLLLIRFEDWIRDDNSDAETKIAKLERNFEELKELFRSKEKATPYFVSVFPVSNHLALDTEITEYISGMNKRWKDYLMNIKNVYVIDFYELLELYDMGNIFDIESDRAGHMPFTQEFYAAMGTMIARKLCAWKKQVFKVLALDCDNTLWKGVCGEDGALGVYLEEPYLEFQRFLIKKHHEGMLLALCSKNNEADVWDVFEKNEQMLLKKEHFVSFRINWQAKSENIKEMAAELNLGKDSFIFIDDSQTECFEVMTNCPEVLTLHLPEKAGQIPLFMLHNWAFDRLKVTDEDKNRTAMYQSEKERQTEQKQTNSLDSFLKGLELKMSMISIDSSQIERAAQLTQRTNQFNLSTIRRTEKEIIEIMNTPDMMCRVIEVSDRFGEYGLVGVLITRETEECMFLESFLLSCRVLGKGIEDAILSGLGTICRRRNIRVLETRYYPTAKNKPVLDFFERTAWEKYEDTGEYISFRIDLDRLPSFVDYIDCYIDSEYPKKISQNHMDHAVATLDHIAIAVSDVQAMKSTYMLLGYECCDLIHDPLQNSDLMMCKSVRYDPIELVSPVNSHSPSYDIVKRKGDSPYHLCFRVADFDVFLSDLKNMGLSFEIVAEKKTAVLFGNREVMFLFIKTIGLIELLKTEAICKDEAKKDTTVRMIVPESDMPLKFYNYLGYMQHRSSNDTMKKIVTITLEKSYGGKIELIIPYGMPSKAYELLASHGPHIHEICFEIDDMNKLEQGMDALDHLNSFNVLCHKVKNRISKDTLNWNVDMVNEENLYHKNYLLPLINCSVEKLLRLPVYGKIIKKVKYRQADNEIEKIMVDVWEKVLNIEGIGVDDSFFELGGNSMNVIRVISKLSEKGIIIKPKNFYEHPTIGAQSNYIEATGKSKNSMELVVGEVPPLPNRMNLDLRKNDIHHWNFCEMAEISPMPELKVIQEITGYLLKHHDGLRLRLYKDNNEWKQFITESLDPLPVELVDLIGISNDMQKAIIEEKAYGFQKSLSLSKKPFLVVAYYLGENEPGRLQIIIHHALMDAYSYSIFLQDFYTLLYQITNHQELNLPPKTSSIKEWAEFLNLYAEQKEVLNELDYWLTIPEEVKPVPVDYPDGITQNTFESERYMFADLISNEEAELLFKGALEMKRDILHVFMAALARCYKKWSGVDSILLNYALNGRYPLSDQIDLSRTIGWLAFYIPIYIDAGKDNDIFKLIDHVEDRMNGIPNGGLGYGCLRYLCHSPEVREKMNKIPLPEITFNFAAGQNEATENSPSFGYSIKKAPEYEGKNEGDKAQRGRLIDVVVFRNESGITAKWYYSMNVHKEESILSIANTFKEELKSIVEHFKNFD